MFGSMLVVLKRVKRKVAVLGHLGFVEWFMFLRLGILRWCVFSRYLFDRLLRAIFGTRRAHPGGLHREEAVFRMQTLLNERETSTLNPSTCPDARAHNLLTTATLFSVWLQVLEVRFSKF